jgi:two-component system, chemotaxis family, sensor kinase CheA
MKRILFVEDDPVAAAAYRRFLGAHDFEIEVASDGAAGLERLSTYAADAVVVDLMMPKMNGLAMLTAIRNDPRWRELPVIMLTAAAVPMLVKRAEDAGANRVFDKANDKPLAIVNLLHDLLRTTSDPHLVAPTKSGNPDAVLDCWPNR